VADGRGGWAVAGDVRCGRWWWATAAATVGGWAMAALWLSVGTHVWLSAGRPGTHGFWIWFLIYDGQNWAVVD
jgi:hypothetical protein